MCVFVINNSDLFIFYISCCYISFYTYIKRAVFVIVILKVIFTFDKRKFRTMLKIVITCVGFIVWSCILIAPGIQSSYTKVIRQNITLNFNQSVNLKCPLVPSDRAEWTIETVHGSGIHASCGLGSSLEFWSFGYSVDDFGFAGELLDINYLEETQAFTMNVGNFTVQHAQINCTQLSSSVQNMQYVWDIFVTGLPSDQSNLTSAVTSLATPSSDTVCAWHDVDRFAKKTIDTTKGGKFNVSYPYVTSQTMSTQWFICGDSDSISVGKCQFDYFRKQCEDVYSDANFTYTTSLIIQDRDVTLILKNLDSSIESLTIKIVRNGDYFSRYNQVWKYTHSDNFDFDIHTDYVTPGIVSGSVLGAGLLVLLIYTVVQRIRRRNQAPSYPITPAANGPVLTTTRAATALHPVLDDPPTYDTLDHSDYHSGVKTLSVTNNGFSDSMDSQLPPPYPGINPC